MALEVGRWSERIIALFWPHIKNDARILLADFERGCQRGKLVGICVGKPSALERPDGSAGCRSLRTSLARRAQPRGI
jgi:hypothetical protein